MLKLFLIILFSLFYADQIDPKNKYAGSYYGEAHSDDGNMNITLDLNQDSTFSCTVIAQFAPGWYCFDTLKSTGKWFFKKGHVVLFFYDYLINLDPNHGSRLKRMQDPGDVFQNEDFADTQIFKLAKHKGKARMYFHYSHDCGETIWVWDYIERI